VAFNLSSCTTELTATGDQILEIINFYEDLMFTEAVISLYKILKSIDSLIFSCYYSTFEYTLGFSQYASTITNWKKLLYNMTHNAGNVYDLIEELVYRL